MSNLHQLIQPPRADGTERSLISRVGALVEASRKNYGITELLRAEDFASDSRELVTRLREEYPTLSLCRTSQTLLLSVRGEWAILLYHGA